MRSGRKAIVAAACLGLGLPAAGASAPKATAYPAASKRLNVVVILSDDERVGGTSVMKNVQQLLQRHGVTFRNYHVTTSECGPSRASILLGQYAHHTGVIQNFGPNGYPQFHAGSALPVWLHQAGYETALVGKYINDYTLDGHNLTPPGWDVWQTIDSVPLEKYYNYTLDENGNLVHYGSKPADYSTTVLGNKAVDFIRHARKPFFLYYAPIAPHLPAVPAPQDRNKLSSLPPLRTPAIQDQNISTMPWERYHNRVLTGEALQYTSRVREHQLEALLAVDRSVGAIVSELRRRNLLDRTVIFYTSDNGFLWGEHRLGGKIWPYEESTRVPLVVRTPWTAANGTINSEPVLNIDLASTIAALAHVTPTAPQDGRDFAPFLHGRKTPWRNAYVIEYLGRSQLREGGPPPYIAVHTAHYLYVEYRRGWRELYDLRTDPWELRNVASDPAYSKTERNLHRLLHRLYNAPARPPRTLTDASGT